jgi:response regulator RpfG family c-di-GMP phosphodiesterase
MAVDSGDALPTLLIVDDEERILSALRRTLHAEGYEILTCESAHDALEILDERPVDMIISDQRMPGMNGLQFLAEARERCPHAARMLITGWISEIPTQTLQELGIIALINKPWDDGELKETLRRASRGEERERG